MADLKHLPAEKRKLVQVQLRKIWLMCSPSSLERTHQKGDKQANGHFCLTSQVLTFPIAINHAKALPLSVGNHIIIMFYNK